MTLKAGLELFLGVVAYQAPYKMANVKLHIVKNNYGRFLWGFLNLPSKRSNQMIVWSIFEMWLSIQLSILAMDSCFLLMELSAWGNRGETSSELTQSLLLLIIFQVNPKVSLSCRSVQSIWELSLWMHIKTSTRIQFLKRQQFSFADWTFVRRIRWIWSSKRKFFKTLPRMHVWTYKKGKFS